MSAFIVSHKHINALVSAMLDARMSYWDGHNRVYVTRDNAEEVGRILLEENVRSVTYRYGGRIGDDERHAATSYRFAYAARRLQFFAGRSRNVTHAPTLWPPEGARRAWRPR